MSRRLGYKKFIRKVEGKNDDNIYEKKEAGSWLTTRYDLVYRLGSGQINWREYIQGVAIFPRSERQAYVNERERLNIPNGFDCSLGSYQPLRIRLEEASEPQSCDQIGEQQGTVEDAVGIRGSRPAYYIIDDLSCGRRLEQWLFDTQTDSSRSG